jgi:formylglycine-generating enzyme required for sulfatase activity
MKKHLTQSPPSFQSVGVDVAPRIEAVVYHALEKDPAARIPTVDAFIAELREAVAAEGSTMRAGRQTLAPDLGQTLVEHSPDTAAIPPQTTSDTAFDSMAGTVSSAALSPEEQEKISASRIAYEREQQEKDRVAREELAREADARRKAQEEIERKRKEQEERVRKEQEEREERERQQREQMERVERQARELEERLAKLATSIPPSQATVRDLEATQVHQGTSTGAVSGVSLPGVAASIPPSTPRLEVSIPPKPKSNSLMMIGVISLVVLLLGGAAAAYFVSRSRSTTGVGPNGKDPTPSPTIGTQTIKAEMVQIPGGTFQMGRNNGAIDLSEAPPHAVAVSPFLMDKTEVTNAAYAEFVRSTSHSPPDHWKTPNAPAGEESLPVANVSFEDANAFVTWRSERDKVKYRLPTEEEWEYAARNGARNDLYPWGNDWKDGYAVLDELTPLPVGSRPNGKNIWGAEDLIGNVWEWTASKLTAYPGSPGEIPKNRLDWIVIRGPGYDVSPTDRNAPVSSCVRTARPSTFKRLALGFRLVRSA